MIKIAIGGKSRAGKDTFARMVCEMVPFRALSFAEPVYAITRNIQSTVGVEIRKDRALLQHVGESLKRIYGDRVWVDVLASKIDVDPTRHVVVTDLRFPVEYDMLRERGFVTVRVVRSDRPVDGDPEHASETALDDYAFDYTVTNDGSEDELRSAVVTVMRDIMSTH